MEKQVDVNIASLWRDGHILTTVETVLTNKETRTITIVANKYTDKQFEYIKEGLLNLNLLTQKPIYLHRGDNAKGSNEKLKYAHYGDGKYISFVDDDLLLAPNHYEYLIKGCEKYNAYVSLHGMTLHQRPVRSFYGNRDVYRGLKTVHFDMEVDIASNCGSLFKREFFGNDGLKEIYQMCGETSMDDIYMAYACKKRGIPRYVLAHPEGFLRHKEIKQTDNYVFDKYIKQLGVTDRVQTEFINKHWDK